MEMGTYFFFAVFFFAVVFFAAAFFAGAFFFTGILFTSFLSLSCNHKSFLKNFCLYYSYMIDAILSIEKSFFRTIDAFL